jgi:hypothetical protein
VEKNKKFCNNDTSLAAPLETAEMPNVSRPAVLPVLPLRPLLPPAAHFWPVFLWQHDAETDVFAELD